MPAGVRTSFEAYGVVVEAVVPSEALADQLQATLPIDCASRPARRDVRFELCDDATVLADGRVCARWPDLRIATDEVGVLIRHYIAEHSPTHVFVHAGVAGIGSGVVLVPGFSHSGKTSLVAQLVMGGAVYFSDEYAPIDTEGRVHPYPQILRTRGHDGEAGRLIDVPPAQLGTAPAVATHVVATEFRPGAVFAPADGDRTEAALALLQHTVSVRRRPAAAMAAVARAVADARYLRGPRGEASLAALTLFDQCSAGGV